jgi:hypothetical protein
VKNGWRQTAESAVWPDCLRRIYTEAGSAQTSGILFLNLATGTGTNPWGGTLSFQGVDQVSVGVIGGEYVVCNNADDAINSGFADL